LKLGNITFDLREMDDSAIISPNSVSIIEEIASLLHIDNKEFSNYLIFKQSDLGNQVI